MVPRRIRPYIMTLCTRFLFFTFTGAVLGTLLSDCRTILSMRFAGRFFCTVVLCACLRGQGTDGNQKAQHKNVCINCTCYDQQKHKYNLWPLQNLDDPEDPRFVNYYIIRDHTKLRRRRQRECQKGINLMSKTKALHVLHAFLQFSLPFLRTMT